MLQPQTDLGGSYTLIPTHRRGAPCQCRRCRCPIIPGLSSISSAIRPNCNAPPAISPNLGWRDPMPFKALLVSCACVPVCVLSVPLCEWNNVTFTHFAARSYDIFSLVMIDEWLWVNINSCDYVCGQTKGYWHTFSSTESILCIIHTSHLTLYALGVGKGWVLSLLDFDMFITRNPPKHFLRQNCHPIWPNYVVIWTPMITRILDY